jgi:hypothetical protein
MRRNILFLQPARRRRDLMILLMSGLAAVMLIGASACQMKSMSGSGGGAPPPALSASISFCDDGVASCPLASSFSVASMHDLVVKIKWENVSAGNHTESLELLIPGGAAYRVTQDGFLIPGSSAGPFSAQRTFPVLGTPISQRQMTGNWSVRASLDGQPIATQTVELTP